MVFSATSCSARNTSPTIELKIYDGPDYINGFCVYRVEAVVTGYPEPEVTFSKDDSLGSAGRNRCQINLENPQEPYLLEATVTNSSGEATSKILLEWGCEQEVEDYIEVQEQAVGEEETIVEETEEEYVPGSFFDNLEDIVRFEADEFFYEKFATSSTAEIEFEELSSIAEIERTKAIIYSSLNKYFEETLIDIGLKAICIMKSYIINGAPVGGLVSNDSVIVINNNTSDSYIERMVHHEISSLLLATYSFNEEGLRKLNLTDFEYFYEQGKTYQDIYNEGKATTEFSPELYEMGFFNYYSMTGSHDEYNEHVANLFKDEGRYWEITDSGEFPILTAKRDYIINFFQTKVSPGYTEKYFREISQR